MELLLSKGLGGACCLEGCCWCFSIKDSVYSPFSLFEDQALILLGFPSVVLSCSGLSLLTLLFWGPSTNISNDFWCTFLFETRSIIQHIFFTSSCGITRTQFAVPLARIDLICPSDLECHLLRSMSTVIRVQRWMWM